jgi:AcrR family transcriptional regulator
MPTCSQASRRGRSSWISRSSRRAPKSWRSSTGLTQEQLKRAALDAAEAAIRRYGIERFRLVDVAEQLNISHSALYKLFRDKNALMDAVSDRWLLDTEAELQRVAQRKGPAVKKLRDWFLRLHALKLEKVKADPELYAAFDAAASHAWPFIDRHLNVMRAQLESMLMEGVESRELAATNVKSMAQTFFLGTAAFHHPRFVYEHRHEDRVPELRNVVDLLLGINARGEQTVDLATTCGEAPCRL